MTPGAQNIHATLLVLDDRGVILRGPSGSGKSSLAYALMRDYVNQGKHAKLVADDRVILTRHGSKLIGTCPQPIRNYLEIFGAGISVHEMMDACIVDFCFTLCKTSQVARMPEQQYFEALGVDCQAFDLPALRFTAAINIVKVCVEGRLLSQA